MVSGRLAEAFAENSKLKDFHDIVPTSLHTYTNVFSKTTFDSLPECHKWDHTIELKCKPSPRFRKVYLMTLTKQTEMDTFLEEVLATRLEGEECNILHEVRRSLRDGVQEEVVVKVAREL
jgi:hypothetical protein